MKLLTYITKGQANITSEGLRCASPREGRPGWICNKLTVKKNSEGQIAGSFKCERCDQIIEVKVKLAASGGDEEAAK